MNWFMMLFVPILSFFLFFFGSCTDLYPEATFYWLKSDKVKLLFLFLCLVSCLSALVVSVVESKADSWLTSTVCVLTGCLSLLFMVDGWLPFFFVFELSVIVTFFIVIMWGVQPERLSASLYFILYSVVGSFPLLLNMVLWGLKGESSISLFMIKYKTFDSLYGTKGLLLVFVYMALLLKLPIYGGHLWLPKAHVEAPVYGSMMLAAMLLKMGSYGLLRMNYFSSFSESKCIAYLSFWGLVSLMLAGMVCYRSNDLKSLMAFSSVAHMKMMVAGIANMNHSVIKALMLLSLGHGFVSGNMFLMFKTFYSNSGSRKVVLNSGNNNLFWLVLLTSFVTFACKASLPPSLNLFSEFSYMINMVGAFDVSLLFLVFSVFLGGLFSIYIYKMLNHGKVELVKTIFSIKLTPIFILWLNLTPCLLGGLFLFI